MYKVRSENKKSVKVNNLSLIEACRKIVQMAGGIVIDQRGLIAFWCSHENKVKAGFKSNEYEKTQIQNFGL